MKHCDDTSRGCADSGGYACHCYCDLCRAAQGDPDASRIIALESRAAELEAALQNLVEQVGKTVGLPPPSHQCPPDHAYSDFAQAINTALALLAKGGTP